MRDYPLELRHSSGVMMKRDRTRLLLAFKKAQSRKKVETLLVDTGLVLEDAGDKEESRTPRPMQIVNHTDYRFWVRSQNGRPIGQRRFDTIQKVLKERADWIGPVYQLPDTEGQVGLLCPLPNVLVIKLVSGLTEETGKALSQRLSELGLREVQEKSEYLGSYRYYVISDPIQQTAYQLQPILLEREGQLVQEAFFENMPMITPLAVVPNDPLFAQQWNMTQIRAGGAGITGWDISTGVGTVVVCVLDTGCDLTHPDLNFSTPGINLGTMLPDGGPTGSHGTACAGIAAAMYNNGLGPAGVAGNCQIMPLAFQSWTDVEVAAGINFAATNGASVISMSFGWDPWNHAIIDPAIQNAFNLNVVMCVATHNYNGAITYPATNPLVMACGASDQIDNRKSPTSPDGEWWWGSDFGPEMSVVAPGVLIPTTDIQGASGYNNAAGVAGDYFLTFNGTSSATPHVAGLAALIRSLDPTLTNVQVRNIIERTADKVGVVAYTNTLGYPNGTWNQEMGYGRINVLRALESARPLPAFQYAVKFVCGRSTGEAVAPGIYFTAINVHNPTYKTIRFRKKVAVALPSERPGPVSRFFDTKLGPDQAFEIDCQDIRRHAETSADFLKGFVVIESDVELDVVAVYTVAREIQVESIHTERVAPRRRREQHVGLPDLVPVPDPRPGIGFCKLVKEGPDKGKLIVTVKNQGDADAPASITRVIFAPGGSFDLPTPPIPMGGSVDLPPLSMPGVCFNPDCDFTIIVDANNEVVESNEANNTASGMCLG